MRTVILLVLMFSAAPASAQGLGYAIGGPAGLSGFFGSRANTFHVAGGGEIVAADVIGAGGEVGFFDRLIVVSLNGTAHFASGGRARPFVSGGFTILGVGDGEGSFNAWNIGAGADFWLAARRGLRFEFRDHVRPDDRGNVQYWSVRAGFVFR